MRYLKRTFTTILTSAFMLSLLAFSASATNFSDDKAISHKEAVDATISLKIINGYEDGTFQPTKAVTRAEMTKMIAIIMYGGDVPTLDTDLTEASFSDVKGHWAESYIEYCVASGIVAGAGDGTFSPNNTVTGLEAAKMLLVALGYKADVEGFTGSDWAVRIATRAADRKLFKDVTIDPNENLTRDDAAQMIWNALQANVVEYIMDEGGTNVAQERAVDKMKAPGDAPITLMEDRFERSTLP